MKKSCFWCPVLPLLAFCIIVAASMKLSLMVIGPRSEKVDGSGRGSFDKKLRRLEFLLKGIKLWK